MKKTRKEKDIRLKEQAAKRKEREEEEDLTRTKLLPTHLLESFGEARGDEKPAKRPKKTKVVDLSLDREEQVNGMVVRVLGTQQAQKMAPKAKNDSIHRKLELQKKKKQMVRVNLAGRFVV